MFGVKQATHVHEQKIKKKTRFLIWFINMIPTSIECTDTQRFTNQNKWEEL